MSDGDDSDVDTTVALDMAGERAFTCADVASMLSDVLASTSALRYVPMCDADWHRELVVVSCLFVLACVVLWCAFIDTLGRSRGSRTE
jgi:hypothetical protein